MKPGERVEVRGMTGMRIYVGHLIEVAGEIAHIVPDGKTKALPVAVARVRALDRAAPPASRLVATPDTKRRAGPVQRRAPKPARDPGYLAFVRTLPCARCRAAAPSEAHHHAGVGHGAVASKCSDYQTIPLCLECHSAWHRDGCLGHMSHEQTRDYLRDQVIRTLDHALSRMRRGKNGAALLALLYAEPAR